MAYPPPLYSFSGLNFNPTIFEVTDTFTQNEANSLYLKKTVADTATAVETFQQGIITTTRSPGDNTTYGASTAFVTNAISGYQTAAQVTTAILSYGYQSATQVTTAINSSLATFLTVVHTYTANQNFNGSANKINGAGIMSVNGLSNNVIVRLGSGSAAVSPGTLVSFGFTFASNPRVFVTNNQNVQSVSAQNITTTTFRLVSNAVTPTCNWMAIGI